MKPNIILLIIDSFRADKFHHDTKTSITPNIDNLIQTGTYFSQTISSADATLLSWSSIFTGLNPFKTGIRSSRFNKLNQNITTIFDLLKQENYEFYSFTPTFSETIGLFPKFKNNNSIYDFTETLDTGLGSKILSLLSSNESKSPWFLNLHLLDLHYPLLVPTNFNSDKFGFSKYEKIVSVIDSWLGKFMKHIDLENTIIIITSDHGASIKKIKKDDNIIDFEDNGEKEIQKKKITNKIPKFLKPIKDKFYFSLESKKQNKKMEKLSQFILSDYEKRSLLSANFSIDHFLFDEKIKVPLLFVGKGIPKNHKFSKQVGLVDIFPSLCYLLQLDVNYQNLDGRNLFPLKSESIFEELPIYIESNPLIDIESNDVVGIRTSNFKYFRDVNSSSKRVHLFDLQNDPFEENNISSENQEKTSTMESILKNLLDNSDKEITENDELSSDDIENELRKMGYV